MRTHQFLQTRTGDDQIALGDYLRALEDHFHLITRDRRLTATVVENSCADPVMLWAEIIPAVGMLVTERLLTIDPADRNDLEHVEVSAELDGQRASLVIRGRDTASRSLPIRYRSTASSLLFVRRLLSQIGGASATVPDGSEGSAFSFPAVGKIGLGEEQNLAIS
ncbi:MAG: hypothetical protein ACOC7V_16365 [Spirochaetota bacterium]